MNTLIQKLKDSSTYTIMDRSPMVKPGEITLIVIEHEPLRSRWGTFKAHFRKRPAVKYPSAIEEAQRFVANILFYGGILIGIALGISIRGLMQ